MDTKKLRQKILDLAIHGKLVPQDPNDEPASVLLDRIREEKERLIKEGKIKRPKKSASSDMSHYGNDMPFELPAGWVWCTVGDIAYVATGSTPSRDCFDTTGIPYIKMYNLRNQKIDFEYHPQYINSNTHNGKLARSRTEVGDLLMNIVGPPLGKLAIIPPSLPESNFNQAAVLIRPFLHKDIVNKYLFYYLSELSEINSIATKGSAGQVNISLTQSQNMRIAMPPLSEQKRIVSEIERNFKQVDTIENNKAELSDLVSRVKSKILDLAISGKLVPQDPTDEPAIDLLRRINPAFKPCDNPHYENLPSGWAAATVADIFEINPKIQALDDSNAGFVPMTNIGDGFSNRFSYEVRKWAEIKNGFTRFADGDIAVAKISPCLENRKSVIMRRLPNGIGAGTTELNIFRSSVVIPEYGLLFFKSDSFINACSGSYNGVVGQQRVSRSMIEEMQFLVPPLAEQKRIVTAVNEYFAVIDRVVCSLQ